MKIELLLFEKYISTIKEKFDPFWDTGDGRNTSGYLFLERISFHLKRPSQYDTHWDN